MIEIDVHNKDTIKTALRVIGKGGVIIYPTDTLYGFGVDAANDNAIEKLNNIKGRSGPLSVLAPDETTALSWANISLNEAEMLMILANKVQAKVITANKMQVNATSLEKHK